MELNNDPTKEDHIITMGRPVNSLDRIYHLPGTAEVSDNMNVIFVNFFWSRDKSWINRKFRSVNLRLVRALLVCGNTHMSCF